MESRYSTCEAILLSVVFFEKKYATVNHKQVFGRHLLLVGNRRYHLVTVLPLILLYIYY